MTQDIHEEFTEVEDQIAVLDARAAELRGELDRNRKDRADLSSSHRSLAEKLINKEGILAITRPGVAADVARAFGLQRRSVATGKVPNAELLQAAAQRALADSYAPGSVKLYFSRDLLTVPSIHINFSSTSEPVNLPQELPALFEALTDAEPLFHLALRVLNEPGNPDEGTHEMVRISKHDPSEYVLTMDYYRGEPTELTFSTFEEALQNALEHVQS